ncbi:MAG: hypothetical protein DID92_2727743267 [Candidatus Nitrotoga sp. SPKER]|nr:MAG: hypothetical protein DID92_2727743267 [Candidatus Nitrotoga sp. SPKER]
MFNLQDKKRSAYSAHDLEKLEASLTDYWDKSRAQESATIVDLEKHLWLANGAAATASVGFIQAAKTTVPLLQYAGAWAFVAGILFLVILKYVSSFISSRDRYRFQDAKSRFDAEEVSDHVFRGVHDRIFCILNRSYLILQWGAGAAFIAGAILTLIGVRCAA